MNSDQAGAYSAFVEHLLYSAEQMLDVESEWEATFTNSLTPHAVYLCSKNLPETTTDQLEQFLQRFTATQCVKTPAC